MSDIFMLLYFCRIHNRKGKLKISENLPHFNAEIGVQLAAQMSKFDVCYLHYTPA